MFSDIKLEKALPYLLGGAFLYLIYDKFFVNSAVDKIKKDAVTARVKYITMSEVEKDRYAQKKADLIGDILGTRFFSRFRDNSDIITIIKSNNFSDCLVRIGCKFDRPFRLRLSLFLQYSMSSDDIIQISEEMDVLSDAGY